MTISELPVDVDVPLGRQTMSCECLWPVQAPRTADTSWWHCRWSSSPTLGPYCVVHFHNPIGKQRVWLQDAQDLLFVCGLQILMTGLDKTVNHIMRTFYSVKWRWSKGYCLPGVILQLRGQEDANSVDVPSKKLSVFAWDKGHYDICINWSTFDWMFFCTWWKIFRTFWMTLCECTRKWTDLKTLTYPHVTYTVPILILAEFLPRLIEATSLKFVW